MSTTVVTAARDTANVDTTRQSTNVKTSWVDELTARFGEPRVPAPVRHGRTDSRVWKWDTRTVHLKTYAAIPDAPAAYALWVGNGTREVEVRDQGVPSPALIRRLLVEAGLLDCQRCDGFLEVPAGREGALEKWRRCVCAPVTARPQVGWAQVH